MGYMKHHAIVVTGSEDEIQEAHLMACKIFEGISELTPVAINGYQSFFIPPDGSKEGWEDSEMGDIHRNSFIDWLTKRGGAVKWVEVQYGDDDKETKIIRDSDHLLIKRAENE